MTLLSIRDLRTQFMTEGGLVRAVDGISLSVGAGETVAVVGESGCGKSVTALSILRLIASPPGRIAGGTIEFEGLDLLSMPEKAMRRIRGKKIAMVFQEPQTSLHPVFTVGFQVAEPLLLHEKISRRAGRARAIELLRRVGIADPESRVDDYPHQLSGGMKQRAMIAMALACKPSLLIADEPTTALDVTVQSQILALLKDLQRDLGMSVLLITHDLGIVAEVADRVAVMYAGRIVETADVRALFASPRHPYTVGLFDSLPRVGEIRARLRAIPGQVPDPAAFPEGCRFHPRCPLAIDRCRSEVPLLREISPGHASACHRAEEVKR
ncbi:MAG: ABC transporter ATP-binding protein [Planctomycetota bacterium]